MLQMHLERWIRDASYIDKLRDFYRQTCAVAAEVGEVGPSGEAGCAEKRSACCNEKKVISKEKISAAVKKRKSLAKRKQIR